MIRTDGRPTIASYGTPITPVDSEAVSTALDIPESRERVLIERDASELHVELVLIGGNLTVRIIEAQDTDNERVLVGTVPGEKAMDAFEHPYLYV